MVNIFVTNKALKFTWFNCVFKDADNIQFWTSYLYHVFVILLSDVLNCNLHPSNLSWLLIPNVSLPPFWRELFTYWFQQFFVPLNCTDDAKKEKILNLLVTYNSGICSRQLFW